MKKILKKMIKGIMPYGIVYLINKMKNRQIRNVEINEPEDVSSGEVAEPIKNIEVIEPEDTLSGEVVEPREGHSPVNSPFPPPPNIIPENMFHEYTLKGKINVLYSFADSRALNNERQHNTEKKYNSVFYQLQNRTFHYYGKEGEALLQALNNYPVDGKDIIIWGLAGCNCEAIAVWKGAGRVYVVDYNKPICDNEKIEVINHEEIILKDIKADFAVSYSSFEHDGLGRYGDPLSPDGDFRAMREAHKFLKEDGILFLGVPLGEDCIVWNAHRIYGKNRLPLLLNGWQLLDVFDINDKDSPEYPFDLPFGRYIQNVMVLKKIKDDFPDNEYLLMDNIKLGERNKLYKKINKIIYDFKKSS
jgi:SAM-dependent methyltransferase